MLLKISSSLLNGRGFASGKTSCKEEVKPPKPKKSETPWGFFSARQEEAAKKKKEFDKCCPPPKQDATDPDLSAIGGQPYKSCGINTYVIQREMRPETHREVTHEEMALRRIESEPNMKNMVTDPMPPFRSVEQRMLDLSERKLHPFYKRYAGLQRNGGGYPDSSEAPAGSQSYQTRSGPLKSSEIPMEKFKISKDLLDRKNIFSDFKTVQLPRQLLARMAEMNMNRRPTLERKSEKKEGENKVDATEKDN